jgi:hypothetical protein
MNGSKRRVRQLALILLARLSVGALSRILLAAATFLPLGPLWRFWCRRVRRVALARTADTCRLCVCVVVMTADTWRLCVCVVSWAAQPPCFSAQLFLRGEGGRKRRRPLSPPSAEAQPTPRLAAVFLAADAGSGGGRGASRPGAAGEQAQPTHRGGARRRSPSKRVLACRAQQ